LILLLAAFSLYRLVTGPKIPVDPSRWVQLTNFPDSVSQPALSTDGHLLTFVRGPYTFAGIGQIYVKMLPDGEPVQLTRDDSHKMSPAFSPDGSQLVYTTVDAKMHWDTWVTPVLGGQPRLWLPNASGLVWVDKQKLLFSEIKNNDMHMAIVSADESRATEHDVYVPPSDRGMAHRSSPSPDGKWAVVVEMDHALWLPCKLVSLERSSPARPVGPAAAPCTSAAWSADSKWMYFTSGASGAFHIWRQRFPDGGSEQITSGPTEEEGITMAPDGLSFITSVGKRQSSVWVHDSNGTRQVSVEGFSYDPELTPDGRRLCYRILKGALPATDPSDLRVVELASGREESLLPGFAVVGLPRHAYDISADGRKVVVTALDREGKHRLWMASFDHRMPPRQIPNVQGDSPLFAPDGEIFFRALEGNSTFIYRVHEDGTELQKVIDPPVAMLSGISPDGQWLIVKLPGTEGSSTVALRVHQDSHIRVIVGGALSFNDTDVRWSRDERSIFFRLQAAEDPGASGRTFVVPLPRGQVWPEIPTGGLQSAGEIAKLPGASLLDDFEMPGPTPGVYAFVHATVQRNLYKIPLP
jgi:Tol biopolymer transport system component